MKIEITERTLIVGIVATMLLLVAVIVAPVAFK